MTKIYLLILIASLIIAGVGCGENDKGPPPLEVVHVTSEVARGDTFELVVKTAPGAYVEARGLPDGLHDEIKADSAGMARWVCIVNESPGECRIRIMAHRASWDDLSSCFFPYPEPEGCARIDVTFVVREE